MLVLALLSLVNKPRLEIFQCRSLKALEKVAGAHLRRMASPPAEAVKVVDEAAGGVLGDAIATGTTAIEIEEEKEGVIIVVA